jgi:serine/threonine-protein kinase
VFALGTVLYEMLTGKQPFKRESEAETLHAIVKEDPPETAEGTLPRDVRQILRHCLEKRPEDRFQSARDLAFHLRASADARNGKRSPRGVLMASVGAGLLLLALAVLAGCGEGGAVSARDGAKARSERGAVAFRETPATDRCRAQLGGLVAAMDSLRDGLLAGLTYESYVGAVRGLKRAYERVPVERLPLGCLLAVGRPGERALNRYVEAANTWGDCLAQASCEPESIEARLQRSWRLASTHLGEALAGLPARSPG